MTSDTLSLSQCQNVTDAAWFAVTIGSPLNRFITINWTTAGIADAHCATARYLKRAGDWLSDQGVPRAYCWVREAVGGEHVHILMHVPSAISPAFAKLQRQWLRSIGAANVQGVLRTRPVARSYSAPETSPDLYRLNLDNVLRYILKGANEKAAHFTDHRRCRSGTVIGRRFSVSTFLNRTARRSWRSHVPVACKAR